MCAFWIVRKQIFWLVRNQTLCAFWLMRNQMNATWSLRCLKCLHILMSGHLWATKLFCQGNSNFSNRKYAKSSMQTPFLWMEPSRPQKTKVNGLWHTVQPVLTWPWQGTHFGPARENNQVDKRIVLLITLVSNEISVTQIPANRKHVKQSMETLSLWKGESQGGGEPFLKQWQYNLNQPPVHSPV